MYCPKCKKTIFDNSVYCEHCGVNIAQYSAGLSANTKEENKKEHVGAWILATVVVLGICALAVFGTVMYLKLNF